MAPHRRPDAADGSDYQQTTWLQMLYDRGAGGSFDGVANHPYAYPFSPLTDKEWNAYRQTEFLHDIMAAHGDGAKKVWGTEMGAPTGTQAKDLTEAGQAQSVRDYFTGWWNGRFRCLHRPARLVPAARRGHEPGRPELRPPPARPVGEAGLRPRSAA